MDGGNGEVEDLSQGESAGVGVRALVGSSWGFYAIPDLSDSAARRAGATAASIANASARVPGPSVDLVKSAPVTASWSSACEIDPLSVALSDKGDLLVSVTAAMRAAGADHAEGSYNV